MCIAWQGPRASLLVDSVLVESGNRIVGFRRMMGSQGEINLFNQLVGDSVYQVGNGVCRKLGQTSMLLVIVVSKRYCEDLAYDTI